MTLGFAKKAGIQDDSNQVEAFVLTRLDIILFTLLGSAKKSGRIQMPLLARDLDVLGESCLLSPTIKAPKRCSGAKRQPSPRILRSQARPSILRGALTIPSGTETRGIWKPIWLSSQPEKNLSLINAVQGKLAQLEAFVRTRLDVILFMTLEFAKLSTCVPARCSGDRRHQGLGL